MTDKLILTNISALKAKYGAKFAEINKAIDKLIVADKKRGLQTRFIALDDEATMSGLNAEPVSNQKDPRQNKKAVDGLYKKLTPDYLLLLGSIDVIPHQDLKNPVYQPGSDNDAVVLSDAPYACETTYSRKPEDFIGVTRVVGRLPDLTGAKDPAHLVNLLSTAASFKSTALEPEPKYFGLSAAMWEGSTRLSLDSLFGNNKALKLSPAAGPKWTQANLKKKFHFINCHGLPSSSQFFGQKGSKYPVSHDAKWLANRIKEGTIVAAECCYGADLFNSFTDTKGQKGICDTYLEGKAYGFFGSSTIAYGPADTNGSADLLCQYFLKYVMEGASLGRAALQARQKFASESLSMDPVDLKTITQFNLMGDPSIAPIDVPSQHTTIKTTVSLMGAKSVPVMSIDRKERRQQNRDCGLYISKHQSVVRTTVELKTRDSVKGPLKRIAENVKMKNPSTKSFAIKKGSSSKGLESKSVDVTAFHVMMEDRSDQAQNTKAMRSTQLLPLVCVVAKEVNGSIISYKELFFK